MYPDGRLSVTNTPVALLGPALLTVMVNIILSPTFGAGLFADLVISKSAPQTLTTTSCVCVS